MFSNNIGLYIITCILAAGTPGPGTLAVLNSSSLNGLKKTLPLMLGIIFGMGLVGFLSALGVNAAAIYSKILFDIIRIAGGIYIGYIAIMCFKNAFSHYNNTNEEKTDILSYSFITGVMVVSLSPKTFMFFSALLPTFVIPNNSMEFQFLALTIILLMCTFLVHIIYAFFCSASKEFLQSKSFYIDIVSGITFAFFSITAIIS